jgi:hypothetical protein
LETGLDVSKPLEEVSTKRFQVGSDIRRDSRTFLRPPFDGPEGRRPETVVRLRLGYALKDFPTALVPATADRSDGGRPDPIDGVLREGLQESGQFLVMGVQLGEGLDGGDSGVGGIPGSSPRP